MSVRGQSDADDIERRGTVRYSSVLVSQSRSASAGYASIIRTKRTCNAAQQGSLENRYSR